MDDTHEVTQLKTNNTGIYTPASIHIGQPSAAIIDTHLPYIATTVLPTNKQPTPRNHSYAKLRRRSKKVAKDVQDDICVSLSDAAENERDKNGGSLSLLELQVSDVTVTGHGGNRKSLSPDHGMKYVENYKNFLRQKGVRYQEVFGHTPRKPLERLGARRKPTCLVNNSDKSDWTASPPVNLVTSQQSGSSDTSITQGGGKLPGLITVEDLAKTATSRDSKIHNDGQSQMTQSKTETTDVPSHPDVTSHQTEDEGYSTDISAPYFSNLGMTKKRQPRKRGKLGDVMTQKKMKELLETQEPLKLENYYNVYT